MQRRTILGLIGLSALSVEASAAPSQTAPPLRCTDCDWTETWEECRRRSSSWYCLDDTAGRPGILWLCEPCHIKERVKIATGEASRLACAACTVLQRHPPQPVVLYDRVPWCAEHALGRFPALPSEAKG